MKIIWVCFHSHYFDSITVKNGTTYNNFEALLSLTSHRVSDISPYLNLNLYSDIIKKGKPELNYFNQKYFIPISIFISLSYQDNKSNRYYMAIKVDCNSFSWNILMSLEIAHDNGRNLTETDLKQIFFLEN